LAQALTAPRVPCGSCPYRRDVPSGIWEQGEYDKLLKYDGKMADQAVAGAFGVFMCHQRDGNLCGGWLACHGADNLLAMRIACAKGSLDASVFDYKTDVPVFRSGRAARKHGIRAIDNPKPRAKRMMAGLLRKRIKAKVK
jgi:hypothetical protein